MIVAQIAAAGGDSIYASVALRETVARAAAINRVVPPALAAYQAHVETEMALILVDTLGRERTGQVEQMGGTVRWRPDSGFFTHIEGYRTQSSGFPISMIGVIRNWTVPMLYGQRLLLGLDFSVPPEEGTTRTRRRRDTLRAVHRFRGEIGSCTTASAAATPSAPSPRRRVACRSYAFSSIRISPSTPASRRSTVKSISMPIDTRSFACAAVSSSEPDVADWRDHRGPHQGDRMSPSPTSNSPTPNTTGTTGCRRRNALRCRRPTRSPTVCCSPFALSPSSPTSRSRRRLPTALARSRGDVGRASRRPIPWRDTVTGAANWGARRRPSAPTTLTTSGLSRGGATDLRRRRFFPRV